MSAKDFLEKKLQLLVDTIPDIEASYFHDELAEMYLVEIKPSASYYNNNSYINWENSFQEEFAILFSYEAVCFITEDSIVQLEKVDRVFKRTSYIETNYNENPSKELFEVINTSRCEIQFDNFWNDHFDLKNNNVLKKIDESFSTICDISVDAFYFDYFNPEQQPSESKTKIENSNFAMAA